MIKFLNIKFMFKYLYYTGNDMEGKKLTEKEAYYKLIDEKKSEIYACLAMAHLFASDKKKQNNYCSQAVDACLQCIDYQSRLHCLTGERILS